MKRFLLNLEVTPGTVRLQGLPISLAVNHPGTGTTARVPNGFIHRGTHIVAGYRRQAEALRALFAEFLEPTTIRSE
jgi:hypothetical protein